MTVRLTACKSCDMLINKEPRLVEHTGIDGDSIEKQMVDCPNCEGTEEAEVIEFPGATYGFTEE